MQIHITSFFQWREEDAVLTFDKLNGKSAQILNVVGLLSNVYLFLAKEVAEIAIGRTACFNFGETGCAPAEFVLNLGDVKFSTVTILSAA